MDPADVIAPSGATWEPWPARSRARASFLLGELADARRISARLFRRPLEPCEYAGLAGAPDEGQVEIGASRGMLYIEVSDPAAAFRAFHYVRRAGRDVVLAIDGFHIFAAELRGRGFGLHVFLRQAQNAARLGVRRIETAAGRRCDENGYYTWPRFGFDAILSDDIRRILPPELANARTLLSLTNCDRGRRWWREHGETILAAFDLTAGSRSRQTLNRYVRAKTLHVNSSGAELFRLGKIRAWHKNNLENRRAMSYGGSR